MDEYCLYLRKSRIDLEAEANGQGDTLARHRADLLKLARKRGLNITGCYEEVRSGESIAERPEMQRLLNDVEAGRWTGVLVMEVERLARGNTTDQGVVADTFKYSDTKIVTPNKVYDPGDEFDEEYFEFGLFMSRREYKTINRRLQRGRRARESISPARPPTAMNAISCPVKRGTPCASSRSRPKSSARSTTGTSTVSSSLTVPSARSAPIRSPSGWMPGASPPPPAVNGRPAP